MAASSEATTWFITGCSSGFGWALAKLALSQGHNVIATSRNPQKTPDLVKEVQASPRGRWLTLDMCASTDVIKRVVHDAEAAFGGIDVVVNNAGYSLLGAWENISEEDAKKEFETNVWGPQKVMKAVIPGMRDRHSGTIVNITSIAGIDPKICCS